MKNIILSIMIISSFGCQTTSTSTQDKEELIEVASDSGIQDSITTVKSSNPDEVTLKIKLVDDFTSSGKEICGVSKKNVFKIKILEILEKGSAISHLPHNNDEILVNFLFPNEDIAMSLQLEVKAKETLCLDASKSYFTVISHKILE